MTEILLDTQTAEISRLLHSTMIDTPVPGVKDSLQREAILSKMKHIKSVNLSVVGEGAAHSEEMLEAYEKSVEFVHRAFDEFESKDPSENRYDWAFLVPARGSHASEVTDFLPVFDEIYGTSPELVHKSVAHLAPTQIQSYKGVDDINGMIIFTPSYFDSSASRRDFVKQRESAAQRAEEAARMAKLRYGVGLIGLGAVLPGVTKYGTTIKEEGLITTTGHGGTVHLVSETVRQVLPIFSTEPRVGVLGLGAIGSSAFGVLSSGEINNDVRSFHLYDTKPGLISQQAAMFDVSKTFAANSEADLLDTSDIIVSAITGVIDLKDLEEIEGRRIDLSGKVIVDDSQPGCFDREQVEARGGKLVWVVGNDESESQFLHRTDGYSYGSKSGLFGAGSVWGCEAEAGSLATLNHLNLAIKRQVTPETARIIGEICLDAGIRAASPLQSFGRIVEI